MALVTDLELPVLDYLGPDLKGERFHEVIEELRARHWVASSPIGFVVLDREAAAFFLRTRSATFPGMRIAEMFDVPEGLCSSRCAATSCTSTATRTGACAGS